MSRESYVRLSPRTKSRDDLIPTFWFKCISPLSLVAVDDSYDDSTYVSP